MQKHIQQHTRFAELNDASLSPRCYWHVQMQNSIEPIGKVSDSQYQRPESFFVQV